ncbi:hypothetical protein STEG23_001020 [Scotinomys teguina]
MSCSCLKKLKIKKSTLERFLNECDVIAPWFTVSGSLMVASWEKLGRNLDFTAEQGTLQFGVRSVWKLVRSSLEDQRCSDAVENRQATLQILQEERSEKANSEKAGSTALKEHKRIYPDLSELESLVESESSESSDSDEMRSVIKQLSRARIRKRKKREAKRDDIREPTSPACCTAPPAPPPYGGSASGSTFAPETWRAVRTELHLACPVFQNPQGQRYHEPLDFKDQQDPIWVPERLVRRINGQLPMESNLPDAVSDADERNQDAVADAPARNMC